MTVVSADDKAVVEDTLEKVELAGMVGVGVGRVLEGVVARHGEGAVVDDEVVVGLW